MLPLASHSIGLPPAVGLAPLLAAIPLSLIRAVALLSFGILLMVSVILLLRREAEGARSWEAPPVRGGPRHLQHISRLLRSVRTVNNVIIAERNPERLLEKVCSSLTTTRGYRMAWVGFLDEETLEVKPVCHAGHMEGYLDDVVITADESETGRGPTGRAIRSAEPCLMRHIDTAPEYEPWRQAALERGYRSSAALPLRFEGKVLGVLNVYSDSPDAFEIEEVGLLQEVADHLAYALASIRLEESYQQAQRRLEEMSHVRAAFRRLPFGVLVTDPAGLILAANHTTMELLSGYAEPEELIEKVKIDKLELFDEADLQPLLNSVLREGRSAEESFPVSVDGRESRLLCSGLPVTDEEGELSEAVWILKKAENSPLSGE